MIAERITLEAKRDLRVSALSFQQIATRLGFEDRPCFSRFFTHNAGVPTKVYREREQARLEG